MDTKIKQSVIGGVVATAVMTIVMVLGAMMGMPKMSPPDMLSGMMGVPLAVGWIMHFMIGVIFALAYGLFFHKWVRKIENRWVKGVVFGLAVFVFAQIVMAMMGAPSPEGSKTVIMMGSIIGHGGAFLWSRREYDMRPTQLLRRRSVLKNNWIFMRHLCLSPAGSQLVFVNN